MLRRGTQAALAVGVVPCGHHRLDHPVGCGQPHELAGARREPPLAWRNGTDLHYRAWWWHRMTTKLDALGNVIPADQRPRIEAALAEKVPKVARAL
jgi:hypothetical protein